MTRSREGSCCHGQALGLDGAGMKRGTSAAMHPWICPSLPEPSESRRSLAPAWVESQATVHLGCKHPRSFPHCQGPWSLPASQRPGQAPLSSGTPSRPLSSRVKHYAKFSQLLVVNATAADTGEYSCWSLQCQDSPCQEGEDRTGKTFVFFAGQGSIREGSPGQGWRVAAMPWGGCKARGCQGEPTGLLGWVCGPLEQLAGPGGEVSCPPQQQ